MSIFAKKNHFFHIFFFTLLWLVLAIPVLGWLGLTAKVTAQDCEQISCNKDGDEDAYIACIQTKKSCLQEKISQIQGQKATLTNTIGILNSKILVQELQINQIKAEIAKLEREIDQLAERISGLNVSLDRMSSMLVERVRAQYKQSRVSPFTLLFAADTFDEFTSKMEYLAQTSAQTAEGMHKAEIQRILYDQQKELKEKKQAEVEVKKKQLDQEKEKLNGQIKEQRDLLTVTNNDENKYQQLLSEAEAQIASFKKFVTVSGGGVVGPDGLGKGYDGNYYSQRDSRWAGATIGRSNETIFNVGCLITSLAMSLKSKGADVTPLTIASNNSYFFSTTAYMLSRSGMSFPNGKKDMKIAISSIDSELGKNNPVIVGLKAGPYGTHFVVIKRKDGDNWIMYDPWYGPDLVFTSHYSKGSIYSAEIIY